MIPKNEYYLDSILLDNNILNEIIEAKQPMSYAKLCDRLGIKKKGGESKISQLKKLNEIVYIEKINSKFMIERFRTEEEREVYAIQGTYTTMITRNLYTYLTNSGKRTVGLTLYEIMNITGLANENYKIGKYNIEEILSLIEKKAITTVDNEVLTKETIDDFFDTTYCNNRSRILLTLKRMKESKLIDYTRVYYYSIFTGKYYATHDFSEIDIENLLEVQRLVIKKIIEKRPHKLKIGSRKEISYTRSVRLENGEKVLLSKSENHYYSLETRRIMIESNCWANYSARYEINVNTIGMKEIYLCQTDKLKEQIERKNIESLKEEIKSPTLIDLFLSNNTTVDISEKLRNIQDNQLKNKTCL